MTIKQFIDAMGGIHCDNITVIRANKRGGYDRNKLDIDNLYLYDNIKIRKFNFVVKDNLILCDIYI